MTFVKDPDSELDYSVHWDAWLGSDTIANVLWLTDPPLTVFRQSHTATVATVWLRGGASRKQYPVTCRITTAGGRVEDHTFTVAMQHK